MSMTATDPQPLPSSSTAAASGAVSQIAATPGTPAPGPSGAGPVAAGTAVLPDAKKSKNPIFSAEAWAPLQVELFRSLWIATSIAQIGTWVREAAGPTLMESLTNGMGSEQAKMVARVLTFSNLPITLFSVFAGALADVLDRRRLLIFTQIWMVVVSAVLGLMTVMGLITPSSLLGMTFLLGVGTAAFGPALQAVLPELVPKQHFALAINLNSIALNVARALGPALFILVVAVVPGNKGAGISFFLTGASFVGSLWVMLNWKRPPQRAGIAGEGVWNGIRAGFRYTVHSPANRAILLRVFTFIVPAVVIWSQIPIIATQQLGIGQVPAAAPASPAPASSVAAVSASPAGGQAQPAMSAAVPVKTSTASRAQRIQQISALLYAFVGLGAILGVLLMPGLHARFNIDPVVVCCTLLFALGLVVLSTVHTVWLAAPILIFLGINWVIIPTNFNTATQKSVPPWVKGRAISFYLTVLFGSFAVGSELWGRVTAGYGIQTSLLVGGLSMGVMVLALSPLFPLTLNQGLDLSPAFGKSSPILPRGHALAPQAGVVRAHVDYVVEAANEAAFLKAASQLGRQRRRNGVQQWSLQQAGPAGHFRETMVYASRGEFDRQTARLTKADLELQSKVAGYHVGPEPVEIVLAPADRIGWRGERIIG